MKQLLFGTIAYIVSTFAVQATSHFVINVEHYRSMSFLRPEPIFALGFLSMILQGGVLTYLLRFYKPQGVNLREGWLYGLLTGLLVPSYLVLAEPAKYVVPSVTDWMMVEAIAAFLQYSLFGISLTFVYPRKP